MDQKRVVIYVGHASAHCWRAKRLLRRKGPRLLPQLVIVKNCRFGDVLAGLRRRPHNGAGASPPVRCQPVDGSRDE
jgi:hypothetical protein